MAGEYDITDQQGGNWWDENPYDKWGGADPTATVTGWYQKYFGRTPSSDEVNQWATGPYGASGEQYFASSPEGQAYAKSQANQPPPAAGTGPAAAQTDNQKIDALLKKYNSTDDPSYWYGIIAQHGGFDATGADWLDDRIKRGDGSELVKNGTVQKFSDSGGSPLANIGSPPGGPYKPPTAPNYTNYNPGNAPTPTPFVAPTLEEARNAPGFQSALESANQGIQRSAVSRAGLGGGLLKDLSQYDIGLADQNYGNLFNQKLAANQSDNGQALAAWNATTNANLGAGNLNLQGTNQQFQNTYQPGWNAYTFGANYGLQANQQQFGQNLATKQFDLGAQNQYWNQGFNENQNAYNQYDNSQKTAFDQWYKTAQLGNPGNPYT